ncbi:unnamed protein product [Rhizophagus irregularis]|uniref:Helicase ATP-binding domain-containing protein n=1 Tax=Rhizophagus irregularis TaxID=588596 RepID=A0A915Z459_9GLOM|nr:unnamed protein product [Rhizophagus irregularis]
MVNIARQANNTPLSYQDLLNITKIEKERDQQRINNVGRIEKRNAERALALQNIREDLDSFDWNQWNFSVFRVSEWTERSTGITVVFSPLKALVDDQVLELIKVGIPCGGLYASTAQPIWCQRKVFQEIACGLTRVIITTPEKFKFNVGFRQMLEQIGISRGIRFVIDEAHCILDQEHFRDSWSFLCNLKKIFPTAPILLLTATCRMIDAQEIVIRLGIDHQRMFLFRDKYFGNNSIIYQVQKKKDNKEQFLEDILKITSEIEAGKCIIYCISIKECENLLTNLQAKVRKEEIAIYHGELPAKEKSNALSL